VQDLGSPIAWVALEEGTPVYDRDGDRIGVVEGVVGELDIFEGVIVHTLPLPGRHRFADVDQIAEMRERGVMLSVERDALHDPPEKSTQEWRAGRKRTVEPPLEARLRRAWDRITRRR
jgi:uncharacterized protein YrrD